MTEVLTPAQLQELLQIGRKQTYELINDNKIESVRIGRSIRIPRHAVDKFLGIKPKQTNDTTNFRLFKDRQVSTIN
jgi:excisionase family DNA binding protein|tara:strand:- start:63 stop:290 length:228 start_codon:yes stop_codon:yes gene_type:complete